MGGVKGEIEVERGDRVVLCGTCGEELVWVLGMEEVGKGVWLDNAWDEAVCLSGSEEIENLTRGRCLVGLPGDRLRAMTQAEEVAEWDRVIPRHRPVEHDVLEMRGGAVGSAAIVDESELT